MRRGRRAAKRYCTLASNTRVGKGGRKQKHEARHESDALLFSVEVNRTFSVDVGKSVADLEPNRVGIFGVEGAQTVLRCHQVDHQRE